MNLNPNHPTTQAMEGQWHKLFVMQMLKSGEHHLTFGPADMQRLATAEVSIAVQDGRNGDGLMHVFLVDAAEGERLARKEGRLPL